MAKKNSTTDPASIKLTEPQLEVLVLLAHPDAYIVDWSGRGDFSMRRDNYEHNFGRTIKAVSIKAVVSTPFVLKKRDPNEKLPRFIYTLSPRGTELLRVHRATLLDNAPSVVSFRKRILAAEAAKKAAIEAHLRSTDIEVKWETVRSPYYYEGAEPLKNVTISMGACSSYVQIKEYVYSDKPGVEINIEVHNGWKGLPADKLPLLTQLLARASEIAAQRTALHAETLAVTHA